MLGAMNNSSESVVIQTDRLVLAPHRIEDFEESAAMWGDATVVRYIGRTPSKKRRVPGSACIGMRGTFGHCSALDIGQFENGLRGGLSVRSGSDSSKGGLANALIGARNAVGH